MREDIKLEIGRMLLEGVSLEGIRIVVEAMERGEVFGYSVMPDSSYAAFVEYGKPSNIVDGSVALPITDPARLLESEISHIANTLASRAGLA